MSASNDKEERRERLTAALQAAGCSAPRDWVRSELSENIAQFARFRVLREVHLLADAVEDTLADATGDRPELQASLQTLRDTLDPTALHALLRAYAKALGNGFVMAIDQGGLYPDGRMPGWQLVETDPEGEPTGRLIQGLHEDYLDFEDAYQQRPDPAL